MKHIFKIFMLVLLFNSFSFAEIQVSEKVKNLLSKMPIEEFVKILREKKGKKISSFLKMNGVEYDKLNNTVIIKRELLPPFKNVLKAFLKKNKISANKKMEQAKLFAKILAYSTKWEMCKIDNVGTQATAYYINKGYKFKYETIYNGKVLTENFINNTCKKIDRYNSFQQYIKNKFLGTD